MYLRIIGAVFTIGCGIWSAMLEFNGYNPADQVVLTFVFGVITLWGINKTGGKR